MNQNTAVWTGPGKWIFFFVSFISFVIIALRSWLVPFHHDEVATFYFYIQTGDYLPFFAHIDANNHVLNSFLSFVCFKLFGSSAFALRLPNTLSFLLLVLATYNLCKNLRSQTSRAVLCGAFLLSFHFLTFYSTSRGYGLSMALLVYAVSCMLNYMQGFRLKDFLLFILFLQLAISSNLILIMVSLPLLLVIGIAQLIHKQLNWKTIGIHLLNAALLYYWVKFSFFLQENNALYYGEGSSYYKTTYLSLTHLLSGSKHMLIAYAGSALLIALIIAAGINAFKLKFNIRKLLADNGVVFTFILASLIIGFYLLKKLMGVNYPEDRTGLFFYVFFALGLAFVIEHFPLRIDKWLASAMLVAFIVHFAVALNFRKHSLVNYETFPQSFYDYLVKEQQQRKERITISGHRVRELIYAFYNYQNHGYLNLMDDSDFLHMNADYAVALKNEKGYYQNYYDEVVTEPDWNFVLLKRKLPITRKLNYEAKLDLTIDGTDEFYNIIPEIKDTLIANKKPLLAEFDFTITNTDVPNRSWIVMQLDSADQHYYYKRLPLNWLNYKWDEQKTYTYSLVSGAVESRLSKMVFYVYNFSHQHIRMHFSAVRLHELDGVGVNVVSKAIN